MNGKIKKWFSIVLVVCMLLSLVPLHAASIDKEGNSISNGLVVDGELSTNSNAEESNNTEYSFSSEQEISSSTISQEIIKKTQDLSSIQENTQIEQYDETLFLNDNLNEFQTIKGQVTWSRDGGENRPNSVTINLLQNDEVYQTITVDKESEWKYSFDNIPIYDENGNEFKYELKEEQLEGYKTTYNKEGGNGLKITFNNKFKTESITYDYVEIYYDLDDNIYKLGRWGGTDLAGKTISVPTNDFYLYWRTDSSNCSYYGFSIDSIEPIDVDIPENKTKSTLPTYIPNEISGTTYPDSEFDSYTHGNYGNSVNKMWHYSSENNSNCKIYNISNVKLNGNIKICINKEFIFTYSGQAAPWHDNTFWNAIEDGDFKLVLKQNGNIVSEKNIIPQKENNNYLKSLDIDFGEWPEFDSDGNEYQYTIEEQISSKMANYHNNFLTITTSLKSISKQITDDGILFKIENGTNIYYFMSSSSYSRTFNVYKEWEGEYSTETRPQSLSITSRGNGSHYFSKTIICDRNTSSQFIGSYTIKSSNYSDTYNPISVTESECPGYTMTWRVVGDNIYIKNTYQQNREISGKKIWIDDETNRPSSITVKLLQNGIEYLTTTTDATKDWQYSFSAPCLDSYGQPFNYSIKEEKISGYDTKYKKDKPNGLKIKFNENCNFYYESVSEHVSIYYKKDDIFYKVGDYGKDMLANAEIFVPSTDFYMFTFLQNRSNLYGYSIDYIEPAYVDESIGTEVSNFTNDYIEEKTGSDYPESKHYPYLTNSDPLPQRKYYHYTYNGEIEDEYYDEPTYEVFDIVNIKNNEEKKTINIYFNKIIDSTNDEFEKINLDKESTHNFFISLTNQETGDVINGLLDSKEGFYITNIPIGTYTIKEADNIWFNFVSIELSDLIEGIDLKEINGEYILTIGNNAESETMIEIEVINKTNEKRFYDSKYDIKNLFSL